MGLAPSRVVIDADKGFEDTDIFEYKAFGERFANIVESGDSELVIALDGRWGSGKTTFTQQWAGLLRQRGHAVVQFDAFAHDYQDDALIALAGELYARSEGKTEGGLNKLTCIIHEGPDSTAKGRDRRRNGSRTSLPASGAGV